MLLKNVLRALREKWLQLAAIGVIIVTSSLLYTMMTYGLGGITAPTLAYLHESVQEDFSVEMLGILTPEEARSPLARGAVARGRTTLAELRHDEPATFSRVIDGRVRAFEREYPGVSLELRAVKVVDFERAGRVHTALVTTDAARINRSWFEEGVAPGRAEEVALNRTYAEQNGLALGDPFTMLGRRYRVTGFVLLPDYTLTVFGDTLNLDTALQPLVLVTDAAWDRVDADASFRLAGVSPGDAEVDTAFDAGRLPFVTQVIPTSSNMRSGAIYDELSQGRAMSLGLSLFIASIAVVIVAIMMSNLLSAERGQIGILKALGYRRREVARPYLVAVVALALVMLLVGYAVGVVLAEPLKQMYLGFYLLPQEPIAQDPGVFATAVLVPLLFFAAASGLVISRLLREAPLDLLRPHESDYLNVLTRWVSRLLRRARASTKFRFLHAVRNTGSFVVFFVGIMFATILITFSLMMDGMVDRLTVGTLGRVDYAYQAFLDPAERAPDPRPGDERFLSYPYAYVGDRVVSLQGLEPDNTLYRLRAADGAELTPLLRREAVVSASLARKAGIAVGDEIAVRVREDRHALRVAGVADEYAADAVYLDIRALSSILTDGRSTRLYSGVYALEEPPATGYKAVLSKQGLLDQSRSMSTYTAYMSNVMVVSAAVIAAAILVILTAFAVERNYYSISLLKVLGYSRREVNGMILDSYFVYALVSYAVSLPVALGVLNALMDVFLQEYGLVLPLEFEALDVVTSLGVLGVVLVAGTWASRRRIARVPLQEVIKAYGE